MGCLLDRNYLCCDNDIVQYFSNLSHIVITQGPTKKILIPLTHWGFRFSLESALNFEILSFLNLNV